MSDAKVVEEAVAPRKGVRAAGTGHVVFSEEETAALLTALAEPFDPSIVKWKVTATRKRNGGFLQGQGFSDLGPRGAGPPPCGTGLPELVMFFILNSLFVCTDPPPDR